MDLRASYLASGALERAILWVQWGYSGQTYSAPDGLPRFWTYNTRRLHHAFSERRRAGGSDSGNLQARISTEPRRTIFIASCSRSAAIPARAQQITDGIVDWRTPCPEPSAFDQYYFSLGPTFRARHASLLEIEELLLVRGHESRIVLWQLHHRARRASVRARRAARLPFGVGIAGSVRCEYRQSRADGSHGHDAGDGGVHRRDAASSVRFKIRRNWRARCRRASPWATDSRFIRCAQAPACAAPMALIPKWCALPRPPSNFSIRRNLRRPCMSCAGTMTPGRKPRFRRIRA